MRIKRGEKCDVFGVLNRRVQEINGFTDACSKFVFFFEKGHMFINSTDDNFVAACFEKMDLFSDD